MSETEEIYSLLVPLADERLLVPRVCIAEVAAWSKPVPVPGALPWLLGNIEWNGRAVPLLSFEGACNQPMPTVSGRTRIVIFHTVTKRLESGFFGVVTQGFPQLVRVNRGVMEPHDETDWPANSPIICQIRMINKYPLIPDFETLETLVQEQVAAA